MFSNAPIKNQFVSENNAGTRSTVMRDVLMTPDMLASIQRVGSEHYGSVTAYLDRNIPPPSGIYGPNMLHQAGAFACGVVVTFAILERWAR